MVEISAGAEAIRSTANLAATPGNLANVTANKLSMVGNAITPAVVPILKVAVGIGLAVFLFRRAFEGIVLGKNPLRGLGSNE